MASRKNLRARIVKASLTLMALSILMACYGIRPGHGGGQTSLSGSREIRPADIALPEGYRIEAVASGFTFPTGVAFDDTGGIYVLEGGYAYGDEWETPRLLRVEAGNVKVPVAAGDSNGPWTGVVYGPDPGNGSGKSGAFYVAEGGQLHGGRILKIIPSGKVMTLADGMPSFGDHHTDGPAIGPDGRLYFGQGTATNSGVVGLDNHDFGWLARFPAFHDVPCQDITLAGENYASEDTGGSDGKVRIKTGAFSPFGSPTARGQVIKGELPCNGSIMSIPLSGGKPELFAWGFRNPFALRFAPDGRLYVIENGYDTRGSRPVWGAADLLWEAKAGTWYGWPDYSGSKTVSRSEFTPPHGEKPAPLLLSAPGDRPAGYRPPEPIAYLPVHSSADGLDFSRSRKFGHAGEAFVALFGDMSPSVGKVLEPVGFKIVRIDLARGVSEDFAVNRQGLGPASKLKAGGLERPVALRFSPDGNSLYVVDFGIMTVSKQGPKALRQTGVLWRIWKEGKP